MRWEMRWEMIPYYNESSYLEKGSNVSSRLTDSRIRKNKHWRTDTKSFQYRSRQIHIHMATQSTTHRTSYKRLLQRAFYRQKYRIVSSFCHFSISFLSLFWTPLSYLSVCPYKFQLHSSLNTLMSVHWKFRTWNTLRRCKDQILIDENKGILEKMSEEEGRCENDWWDSWRQLGRG